MKLPHPTLKSIESAIINHDGLIGLKMMALNSQSNLNWRLGASFLFAWSPSHKVSVDFASFYKILIGVKMLKFYLV